jgi:hypothetical protein
MTARNHRAHGDRAARWAAAPRKVVLIAGVVLVLRGLSANAEDDPAYFHAGALAGSLKSADPLPLYDADPQHLWNRLFAALYIRPSNFADAGGGPPVARIEGGDTIDFLGWAGTTYWDEPAVVGRVRALLVEFEKSNGTSMIDDPLHRAMLLRDLWAVFDFLVGQNIRRAGTLDVRRERDAQCGRLARIIEALALSRAAVDALPDNYAAALACGAFTTDGSLDPRQDYLPAGLFTRPDEWVEIDFFRPNVHEDLSDRRITLHTRSYRGRSYFRIFYRFPEGRPQLEAYLKQLDAVGVDWRQAAQDGFILLKPDAPQIPVGTEVALVQFMMTLDEKLRPSPTRLVESVRLRNYLSTDASNVGDTDTGLGMNVLEYTLKRRLLFDGLRAGGLAREDENGPIYRVIFQGDEEPDWGHDRRKVLFQQCVDCHMSPNIDRKGVHSLVSIVHMGGFDAGAQPGIALPLAAGTADVRGPRTARWKTSHETYRRLLEYLGR